MRNAAVTLGACLPFAFVCACGGGSAGSGTGPPTQQGSSTQATPTATTTQSIKAAVGGKVMLNASGSQITVTIPAHALVADASVVVSSFTQGPPQPSSGAATVQLPSGAQFLAGFTVSTGGVGLLLPLQVSENGGSAGAGGSVYLAMYGSSGRYTTVDSATIANGSVSNNDANGFVGVSSAGGDATPYTFYTSSHTVAPSPISITVAAATPGPYPAGATEEFSARGSDANGNAYAFTPAFSLSTASLGTLRSVGSNPLSATVAFSAQQATGSVVAKDARTGLSGSLGVTVQSQRPASDGDTYAYTGTLTQEFDRVAPSPMPTSVSTQTVAQTVAIKGGQSFQGQSNLFDLVSSETDTGPLQTVSSQTDTFVGYSSTGSPMTYLEYGSNWQDQNNDSLSYVYQTPRVLDELPESSGQSWNNSAAASIAENDTVGALGAAFSSTRSYNADGTYTETSTYPPGYFNIGSASDHGSLVENADGSGNYSVPIYGAGDVTFGAPVGGNIPYAVYFEAQPQPGDTPVVSGNIPQWYSRPTLYSETNLDKGQVPVPASCHASSAFGANAQQIVQTIDRLDTVLGYTESTTTTTYVTRGYGAICIVMSDVTTSYYDFQGDSSALFYSHPYQITKVSETLGLQESGTTVIGADASVREISARTAYVIAAHSVFARTLERNRNDRLRALHTSLKRTISLHNRGNK